MIRRVRRLLQDERGAAAVEYGLILALIALAIIVAAIAVGGSLTGLWGDIRAFVA